MKNKLPEHIFIETIEKATGLSMNKGEFGFIMGLYSPFQKTNGYESVNTFDGYIVWKKKDNKVGEKKISADESSIELIINFLNEPFPEITEDTKLFGELNDKYFTPDIEDIRVGYECEIENNTVTEFGNIVDTFWSPLIFNENYLSILNRGLKLRVPYLTKEQIEAEGDWIEDTSESFTKGAMVKIKEDGHIYYVYVRKDFTVYISQFVPAKENCLWCMSMKSTIYDGKCKDINTFRYICKLLNIS